MPAVSAIANPESHGGGLQDILASRTGASRPEQGKEAQGGPETARTITVIGTNAPPTVSITSPADGAVFAWKPTITVTAAASDPDGTVTKVEFRDGTTLLGQDTTAPYSLTWKNVPQGSHVLTVRATDNAGAVTTSSPVGITVRSKR